MAPRWPAPTQIHFVTMMKRMSVLLLVLLAASACSGGDDSDQWASLRGELVVEGISSESTRCVIAELEAAGVEPQDLTTAADAATLAAGQAVYDEASQKCFTDAEVGAIVDREIEQILPDVAAALGITVDETRCIVDGFESQGLSFADVARGDGNPAVAEAMAVLMPQCTGAADSAPPVAEAAPTPAPAVEAQAEPENDAEPEAAPDPATSDPAPGTAIYDSPELRELMISGIASGTGQSTEVAECILDSTLAQGLTMEDFVLRGGDEDVLAAITDAGVGCVPG